MPGPHWMNTVPAAARTPIAGITPVIKPPAARTVSGHLRGSSIAAPLVAFLKAWLLQYSAMRPPPPGYDFAVSLSRVAKLPVTKPGPPA